ncbi:MAG: 2-oxoglutarate synthase [Betaproteobacteria bacterium]|nr:2-oxoglutarate synthase [Betaproteobacteria bacterium]
MRTALLAALAASAALPAASADPLYEEGFSMRLGGFQSSADTTLRLDASSGSLGTTISLEDDLGFTKNKTLPVIDAIWRITPRHRIELGYTRLARDAQKTLTGEIRFGDSVFQLNTSVNSNFDSDVWRLTYGWSLYREGGNELSLLLGLHTTSFKVGMSKVGGSVQIAEAADATVPLPTIGLSGTWAIDPQWRLGAAAQFFSLNYGDYDGSLFNGSISAEYRLNRNFALGAGYTVYDYNLDATKNKFRGSFDYKFAGPMLYVTGGF